MAAASLSLLPLRSCAAMAALPPSPVPSPSPSPSPTPSPSPSPSPSLSLPPPPRHGSHSLKVAVIGAGAAGLVAARQLLREGHHVAVLEQGSRVGGTWQYEERAESDPLSRAPSRERVHGSMYASLRTNLPREVMAFRDFPLSVSVPVPVAVAVDGRRYCSHGTVARYLERFAEVFGVLPHVRFGRRVEVVEPAEGGKAGGEGFRVLEGGGRGVEKGEGFRVLKGGGRGEWVKWRVASREVTFGSAVEEVYDAVVVCNGHFSEPKIADIAGLSEWPGRQMHSHNYRRPEPFAGLVVVVVGAGSSGEDIAREAAMAAREVHMCARSWPGAGGGGSPSPTPSPSPSPSPGGKYKNLWRHPMAVRAHADGKVEFADGVSVVADVILHCTGYMYHFPFLRGIDHCVKVSDSRVGPLFEHVFPPTLAPTLSFVGLPWQVAPFPLMEIQSTWIAKVLSGSVGLPSREEMESEIETFYKRMEEAGLPQRFTHSMGKTAVVGQFEYLDGICARCGILPVEQWRREMYALGSLNKQNNPDEYRDMWPESSLVEGEVAAAQAAQLEALRCGKTSLLTT